MLLGKFVLGCKMSLKSAIYIIWIEFNYRWTGAWQTANVT